MNKEPSSLHEEWEEVFDPSRRETRKERKRVTRADRSQFKKTDQKKTISTKPIVEGHILGKVIRIRSRQVEVSSDNKTYICSLKGSFKLEKARKKNLLVVGDNVWFSPEEKLICTIEPRQSLLCRQEHLHRIKQQLVAANVDQVLITVALAQPVCKPAIIDRYLIAAKKGNLTPIIVFNKYDLYEHHMREGELVDRYAAIYRSLGISVVLVSAHTGEGIDELEKLMKDKVSVFSGQSGTGKTHLINTLTGLEMRTGEVRAIGKGGHTTTFAQLLALPFGGWCVDTPGIRSFGIWELTNDDLKEVFFEIFSQNCAFANCWHRGEQGCRLPEAIEEKHVSIERFASYQALYNELAGNSLRR